MSAVSIPVFIEPFSSCNNTANGMITVSCPKRSVAVVFLAGFAAVLSAFVVSALQTQAFVHEITPALAFEALYGQQLSVRAEVFGFVDSRLAEGEAL